MLEQANEMIQKHVNWLGVDWSKGSIRVLDYACGPGTVTEVIHISPFTFHAT